MNFEPRTLNSAFGLLLLLALGVSRPVLAQTKKPLLSEEKRQEMQTLIAQFRKVRGMQPQRLEVIERMEGVGPIGLNQLLEIIQKELGKPLSDYRQLFAKVAVAEGTKKLEPATLEEIAKIRAEVLDLSKQAELKKKDIVRDGNPGLARLKELMLQDRREVLRKHPELGKHRDLLQPLGQEWEKCATLLLYAQFEEEERDRKEKEKEKEAAEKAKAQVKADPEPQEEKPKTEVEEEAEKLELPSFEKYLVKEEELATALAMPMDDQARLTLAVNAQLADKLDPEEARCILDLNLTRALLGLKALQIDPALTAAARDHSTDMLTLKFFSHESPVTGKKTPGDRAERFGTKYSGENIAMGTVDGTQANKMWWHSPGHHKNMLGSHTRVGLGRSGTYWTELFGD